MRPRQRGISEQSSEDFFFFNKKNFTEDTIRHWTREPALSAVCYINMASFKHLNTNPLSEEIKSDMTRAWEQISAVEISLAYQRYDINHNYRMRLSEGKEHLLVFRPLKSSRESQTVILTHTDTHFHYHVHACTTNTCMNYCPIAHSESTACFIRLES